MQEGVLLQGRYHVLQPIGRGAQGECWLVQENSSYWLAKIYRLHHNEWEHFTLVEREAQILRQLQHPGIPAFRDMFVLPNDAAICLIREWIPGHNLEQFVEQQRTSEKEIRRIARQLLDVLDYIHSLSPSVIHRDIKPTNIVFRPDQEITLIDFGNVRDVIFADHGASVVGTYGYTPPEQFLGHPTPASDLYALGATLLFLLSRRHPSSLPLVRNRLMFEPYINVQQRFLRILQQLMAPEVEERFQSAQDVLQALDRCEKRGRSSISTSHTIRELPIPTESTESMSPEDKLSRSRNQTRQPHWQQKRNPNESQIWVWEHNAPALSAVSGESSPFPDLANLIQTLQQRHHLSSLDPFSDPFEVVEAIDDHFGKDDNTGRDWLLRLLHPYDAADLLFNFYDATFLLQHHIEPLKERFSLLIANQSNNAIGQWAVLYFLYKYGWHTHNQRLLYTPLPALRIQDHFPTRLGPLHATRRFLEQFEALPVEKQVKQFKGLQQQWEQISRHYRLCISLRPSHIPILVEQGIPSFEQQCLPSYEQDFQTEWFAENWFRRMMRILTFWPPRWGKLSHMLGHHRRKYQRLGNYAASLHIVHAITEQHLLRLQDEYHWLLQAANPPK